jgi:hypothetical protein
LSYKEKAEQIPDNSNTNSIKINQKEFQSQKTLNVKMPLSPKGEEIMPPMKKMLKH